MTTTRAKAFQSHKYYVEYSCPECGTDNDEDITRVFDLEVRTTCRGCGRKFTIDLDRALEVRPVSEENNP